MVQTVHKAVTSNRGTAIGYGQGAVETVAGAKPGRRKEILHGYALTGVSGHTV